MILLILSVDWQAVYLKIILTYKQLADTIFSIFGASLSYVLRNPSRVASQH